MSIPSGQARVGSDAYVLRRSSLPFRTLRNPTHRHTIKLCLISFTPQHERLIKCRYINHDHVKLESLILHVMDFYCTVQTWQGRITAGEPKAKALYFQLRMVVSKLSVRLDEVTTYLGWEWNGSFKTNNPCLPSLFDRYSKVYNNNTRSVSTALWVEDLFLCLVIRQWTWLSCNKKGEGRGCDNLYKGMLGC